MSYLEKAKVLSAAIDTAAAILTDEQAVNCVALYPPWSEAGIDYPVDVRVRYNDTLYKCLQTHTSQSTWTPTDAPSLWAKVLIVDPDVIPEWEQPDSTNPYSMGDKVTHNGMTWISDIDGNVWEPGVYGWTEVDE